MRGVAVDAGRPRFAERRRHPGPDFTLEVRGDPLEGRFAVGGAVLHEEVGVVSDRSDRADDFVRRRAVEVKEGERHAVPDLVAERLGARHPPRVCRQAEESLRQVDAIAARRIVVRSRCLRG